MRAGALAVKFTQDVLSGRTLFWQALHLTGLVDTILAITSKPIKMGSLDA